MTSRERRLLDKDKEIRKLKGTAGHYFSCTISAAIENEKLKQEIANTKKKLDDMQKDYDLAIQHAKTMTETCLEYKKKLDIAVDALEKIESTKWYDSMSSYEEMTFTAMKALEQIKDNDKEQQ